MFIGFSTQRSPRDKEKKVSLLFSQQSIAAPHHKPDYFSAYSQNQQAEFCFHSSNPTSLKSNLISALLFVASKGLYI
jgi:hypothetical protein